MNRRARMHGAAALLLGAILLAGCAAVPADPAAGVARQWLEGLKNDPDASAYAADAVAAAERAVAAAEKPQSDAAEAAQLGFVAQQRVRIAAYTAAANRDRKAADALIERLDSMRHGNESITTLATNAFGVTPQHLQFKPIGDSPPAPPPLSPAAQPPLQALPPSIAEQPHGDELAAHSPLLMLDDSAFSSGATLKAGAREALDRLRPLIRRHTQRSIVIYFGGKSGEALQRATAVKSYLLGAGVPKQLLFVAFTSDPQINPGRGVRIDFERGGTKL